MKKLLLASVVVLFASNAMAGGLYISPKAGLSFEKTNDIKLNAYTVGREFDLGSKNGTVSHAGLSVGYDFSQWVNLRVEGEYMYHAEMSADKFIDETPFSIKSNVHSLNANVYYDFRNSTPFTPYIGAGVGFSRVNTKLSGMLGGSDDKTKFTYNFQAGLDFRFDDHNTIGIGYRYTDLGEGETQWLLFDETFGGTIKAKHPAHEITASYRFTF